MQSFVGWFNPVAMTRIKFKKPTGFTFPTIEIEFIRPVFPIIHGLFLPVIHIKPTSNNKSVQISIQMH